MGSSQSSGPPWVAVIMGSKSDLDTLMPAVELLEELGIPHEVKVLSAHRTPELTLAYAEAAEERGLEVIIAGAGAAAHLPGMLAATSLLPVLGVPVPATALNGLDALLAIVQMPKGVPVGTLAIGKPGAANAALMAAAICAQKHPEIRERLRGFRERRKQQLMAEADVDVGKHR